MYDISVKFLRIGIRHQASHAMDFKDNPIPKFGWPEYFNSTISNHNRICSFRMFLFV